MHETGRHRTDAGAVLVEFALVAVLLFMMLFAIITFGVLLAAKQTVTQAAAEGARAAIPVRYSHADTASPDNPPANAARMQTNRSMGWLDRTCDENDADGDGLRCTVVLHDCDVAWDAVALNDPDVSDCVTVRSELDQANHPVLPPIPLINHFLPDTLATQSVAQLDNLLVD